MFVPRPELQWLIGDPSRRLVEMSKRVNSLENNVPAFTEDALSAGLNGYFTNGPRTESHDGSTRSHSGTEWLFLTDMEYNLTETWRLGEVTINYQQASEILGL